LANNQTLSILHIPNNIKLARAKELSIPINDEGKGDIFLEEIWIGPSFCYKHA
jgi:hypothetical protein